MKARTLTLSCLSWELTSIVNFGFPMPGFVEGCLQPLVSAMGDRGPAVFSPHPKITTPATAGACVPRTGLFCGYDMMPCPFGSSIRDLQNIANHIHSLEPAVSNFSPPPLYKNITGAHLVSQADFNTHTGSVDTSYLMKPSANIEFSM